MSNSDKFVSHLKASEDARWVVARWLSGRGHTVTLKPLKIRPTSADHADFADDGDIHTELGRFEVKRLGVDFTGAEDWPFKDYIVCGKNAWDRAEPKPYVFVTLSSNMKFAGVLVPEPAAWVVKTIIDKRYNGYSQEFYLTAASAVKFMKVLI